MDGKGGKNEDATFQLSDEQRERVERNRDKAKALRKARVTAKPYDRISPSEKPPHTRGSEADCGVVRRRAQPRQVDTHAGYMLEEEEEEESARLRLVEDDVPALPDERMTCDECGKKFAESFLFSKFKQSTCDNCRDKDGKHSLITKTEAKQRFLLKDCDFEERGGGTSLPFLLKRNPHSSHWGDMKLYLLCQVEGRVVEVWGGEGGLEEERQRRSSARELRKEKNYAKKVKELRRSVKSSVLQGPSRSHTHTFPVSSEQYNAGEDTWTKTCAECGYQITFEKM